MGKSIVFLGVCILLASLAIAGAWVYSTISDNQQADIERQDNRYFYGVSAEGGINSAVDKQTGRVYYASGYLWDVGIIGLKRSEPQ